MTSVKEAVRSATAWARDLYPGAKDVRLEAVERTGSQWSVVLSFRVVDEDTRLANIMQADDQRLFKTIAIDADDGQPLALQMWER